MTSVETAPIFEELPLKSIYVTTNTPQEPSQPSPYNPADNSAVIVYGGSSGEEDCAGGADKAAISVDSVDEAINKLHNIMTALNDTILLTWSECIPKDNSESVSIQYNSLFIVKLVYSGHLGTQKLS